MNLNILGLEELPPAARSDATVDVIIPDSPRERRAPTPFHNMAEPSVIVQKEKEVHRIMAYMFASGASVKKVAQETGYSEGQVSLLHRQPWFKTTVATMLADEFGDDVSKMLKAAATEALMVIRDIANNGQKEETKLKAATDLLDRHRGKATNYIHTTSGNISEDPLDEMKRLRQDLLES